MLKGKKQRPHNGNALCWFFFSYVTNNKKLQTKCPKSCIVRTLCQTKLMTIENLSKLRKVLISYFKHYDWSYLTQIGLVVFTIFDHLKKIFAMCIDICIVMDVMFQHNEDKWNNIFEKKCEYKTLIYKKFGEEINIPLNRNMKRQLARKY